MERKQFIDTLFARAKEAGFETCEVYVSASDSFSTQVRGGEILSYDAAQTMGLGFRGLYGGKMGYASTQILDEDAIDLLVDGAKANAQLIESEDKQFIHPGDASYAELDATCKGLERLSAADKIAMARAIEEKMLAQDGRIESGEGCVVGSVSQQTAIVNTLGLNVSSQSSAMLGYAIPNAREGEDVASEFAFSAWMNTDDIDLDALAAQAARNALDGLGAQSMPSGRMPVLLTPEAAMDFLSTFSSVFSADQAQKDMSLLKGREGEVIAAGCVTLMDDPHMPASIASVPFDGEGVATIVKKVIDEGRLTTLLHNLKTAHKQGVKSTGNAVRTYASTVSIAPSNFYIAPGESSPEELAARMGDGLILTSVAGLHAGANDISGDFSLSAKGFKVEGGKKTSAVKQITVAGNFFQLLKDIQAVGSDLRFGMPGLSRFGSPSLLVSELSIAGE